MLLDYCIGRSAVKVKEFYILPVGDKLIQYDTIAVNTIVKNKEGEIFIDPTGKKNGRGAYIKLDINEAIQAKAKKVFNRSFSMDVPEAFYDELIAYVDHKVKRRELGLE